MDTSKFQIVFWDYLKKYGLSGHLKEQKWLKGSSIIWASVSPFYLFTLGGWRCLKTFKAGWNNSIWERTLTHQVQYSTQCQENQLFFHQQFKYTPFLCQHEGAELIEQSWGIEENKHVLRVRIGSIITNETLVSTQPFTAGTHLHKILSGGTDRLRNRNSARQKTTW